MVSFADYEMLVQYAASVIKENLHTRRKVGLFDVSHMGQIILRRKNFIHVAMALEKLIPMDIIGLKEGRQRYGFFTNKEGGFLGDKCILGEIVSETKIKRIGIMPEGCAPVREGSLFFSDTRIDQSIGIVTSGGFSLTLGGPVSMGCVLEYYSNSDTQLFAEVRGKRLPVKTAKFPFIVLNFKKWKIGKEDA